MDTAKVFRTLAVFGGALAFFLTPLLIYFSMYPHIVQYIEGGRFEEAATYIAEMFLYQRCLTSVIATLAPSVWLLASPATWFRARGPLVRTLVIIAAGLSIVQTIYLAVSVAESGELRHYLASRILRVVGKGVGDAASYASILTCWIGALCATPSAVSGAALFGLWIASKGALNDLLRKLVVALSLIMVLRTVVALLEPTAIPMINTLTIILSMALGIVELVKRCS